MTDAPDRNLSKIFKQSEQGEQGTSQKKKSALFDKIVYGFTFLASAAGGLLLLDKYGSHNTDDLNERIGNTSAQVRQLESRISDYDQLMSGIREENKVTTDGLKEISNLQHQAISALQLEINNYTENLRKHVDESLGAHQEEDRARLNDFEECLLSLNKLIEQYQQQLQESSALSSKTLEDISKKLDQYRQEMQVYASEFRQHASHHPGQQVQPAVPLPKPELKPAAPQSQPAPQPKQQPQAKPSQPVQKHPAQPIQKPAQPMNPNYFKPEEFLIGSNDKYGSIKGIQVVVNNVKAYKLDIQNHDEKSAIYAIPVDEIKFPVADDKPFELAILREKDIDSKSGVMHPKVILKANLVQYSFRRKGREFINPKDLEAVLDAAE